MVTIISNPIPQTLVKNGDLILEIKEGQKFFFEGKEYKTKNTKIFGNLSFDYEGKEKIFEDGKEEDYLLKDVFFGIPFEKNISLRKFKKGNFFKVKGKQKRVILKNGEECFLSFKDFTLWCE